MGAKPTFGGDGRRSRPRAGTPSSWDAACPPRRSHAVHRSLVRQERHLRQRRPHRVGDHRQPQHLAHGCRRRRARALHDRRGRHGAAHGVPVYVAGAAEDQLRLERVHAQRPGRGRVPEASGELVESRTYRPYGNEEQDYRTARGLGLICFEKRFLVPSLGRWLNPDPLALHAQGRADANLYAFTARQLASSPASLAAQRASDNVPEVSVPRKVPVEPSPPRS